MDDIDLFAKASKAGYDYRELYGKFPDKIGIHYKRLSMLRRGSIIFPVMPPRIPVMAYADLDIPPDLTISMHYTRFEPVRGQGIIWDEVYLPVPESEQGVMPGERLARMAKEFE